jgi:transcriptional regulator with PAS, ATPase and Fis domain
MDPVPQPRAPAQGEVQVDWSSHGILGRSRALLDELDRIRRAAPTRLTILIVGPSGTGKENAARAAHRLSRRRSGPFVVINCGAIPPNLVESELFGVERGAFTGAVVSRPGVVERADGGTLFLDEIGEMPLEVQVKLLRFIQEGTFMRVGGGRERRVDVRIVLATNKPLKKMVAEGTFREDLFYRIAQVLVFMPSLAERDDDVILLAEHFLARMASEVGWEQPRLSRDAREFLRAQKWPGNVRQLKNVIEQAVVLRSDERVVGFADLDDALVREARLEGTEAPVKARREISLDERVVQLLGAGRLTFKELRQALAWTGTRQTLRRRLQPLEDEGIIETEKEGRHLVVRLVGLEPEAVTTPAAEMEGVTTAAAETKERDEGAATTGDAELDRVLAELGVQPGGFSKKEFCERTGMKGRTATRRLARWCEEGVLVSNGKGGAARRYSTS